MPLICVRATPATGWFSVFRENEVKRKKKQKKKQKKKKKHTWFTSQYCPLLVKTFPNNSCEHALPNVILRDVNNNISVGHVGVCDVTCGVTYAYGCIHSERENIQRAEIMMTKKVVMLIKQLNTWAQLFKTNDIVS